MVQDDEPVADDEPVVAEPVAEPIESPVVETRKNKDIRFTHDEYATGRGAGHPSGPFV